MSGSLKVNRFGNRGNNVIGILSKVLLVVHSVFNLGGSTMVTKMECA